MKTNRKKLSEVLEKRGYKNDDLINEIEQIYNKQQLPIHGVVKSLPTDEEMNIELNECLNIYFEENEYDAKKEYGFGFRKCFRWLKYNNTK